MSLRPFVLVHAVKGSGNPWIAHVHRTNTAPTLPKALRRAQQIRRAGYLVWIEATGKPATRC
jgi:hypothetical protein